VGSITVAGGIGWIIANQLVDVANQLPLYRQNIHAKIEAFHIPVTGQVGQAAESVREIVREITGPGTASPGPPAQRRNQKQPSAPPAPMPPMPVRMVESQPRRSTAATRALMVLLSRFLDWREALVIVKPRPAGSGISSADPSWGWFSRIAGFLLSHEKYQRT